MPGWWPWLELSGIGAAPPGESTPPLGVRTAQCTDPESGGRERAFSKGLPGRDAKETLLLHPPVLRFTNSPVGDTVPLRVYGCVCVCASCVLEDGTPFLYGTFSEPMP